MKPLALLVLLAGLAGCGGDDDGGDGGGVDGGYCSPICASDADCRDGYTGPATGMLSCFVPDQPDACTIVCDGPADCPGELTCVATGGPVSVCTTE